MMFPTYTHSAHSLTAKHTAPDAPIAANVADPLFVFFNHPKGLNDIINIFLYQQE